VVVIAAVELCHVSFHFDDARRVLRDVSLRVMPGERVALIGPNGAGKTTLLLHVAGLLPESDDGGHGEGEVTVFGEAIGHGSADVVRRQVGLLFQDPDDQLFCPTVGEDVGFGPRQLGLGGDPLARRVSEALARVGLEGFERRLPHHLSGGEKRRVALAGLLAYEPGVLVLDEPTSGLDPRARRQLIGVLGALSATQLIATHDLALAAELCPRAVVLDGGGVAADGLTRELLRDDACMLAHGLEKPSRDLPAYLLDSDGASDGP
jgi:energy-coupling factor transporter ATP-binding protein EcfA2